MGFSVICATWWELVWRKARKQHLSYRGCHLVCKKHSNTKQQHIFSLQRKWVHRVKKIFFGRFCSLLCISSKALFQCFFLLAFESLTMKTRHCLEEEKKQQNQTSHRSCIKKKNRTERKKKHKLRHAYFDASEELPKKITEERRKGRKFSLIFQRQQQQKHQQHLKKWHPTTKRCATNALKEKKT